MGQRACAGTAACRPCAAAWLHRVLAPVTATARTGRWAGTHAALPLPPATDPQVVLAICTFAPLAAKGTRGASTMEFSLFCSFTASILALMWIVCQVRAAPATCPALLALLPRCRPPRRRPPVPCPAAPAAQILGQRWARGLVPLVVDSVWAVFWLACAGERIGRGSTACQAGGAWPLL